MGHFLRQNKILKNPVHQESIVITKSWSHDMLGDGSSGIMEGAAYAEPHRKQSTQFETPHRKQSKAGLKHRVGFFSFLSIFVVSFYLTIYEFALENLLNILSGVAAIL